MTMHETENDVSDGICSRMEQDCFYSSLQVLPGHSQANSSMRDGKVSSGHSYQATGKSRSLDSTPEELDHMQEDEKDTDSFVNSICDQLDSFDMAGDQKGVNITRSLYRNNSISGAQPPVADFQQVYVQNRDGDTWLHLAIILQQTAIALQFIDVSPLHTWLNLRNHVYQTALHLAVITKQLTVVRRLIVGGADIESRDRFGNTPLHIACRDGYIEGVRTLLEPVRYVETKQNSYDIPYQRIPQNLEITNYDGVTALHLAATNGHLDIVKLLVEKQADVNSRDSKSGQTILHKACSDGNLSLVRFLLGCKDCDINARTYDDYTPFDFARGRSYERIKFELAVAGAKYANENEEYD